MATKKATTNGQANDLHYWDRMAHLVSNVYSSRQDFIRRAMDPRRNIEDECGYPSEDGVVTADFYQRMYERSEVAARVVEVLPMESQQVPFEIYEDEDPDRITPFEQSLELNVNQALRVGKSWLKDEGSTPLHDLVLRADIQQGIGSYGIMLLGLDDRQPLQSEVVRASKLLYATPYPESMAQISQYETDKTNPRYGQPTKYLVTLNDVSQSSYGQPATTAEVHWTRVIHLADNCGPSRVFGTPRLRPVLNRILDLRKVYSSDAEAYWRNVIMKIFLSTHPALGEHLANVDFDTSAMRDDFEKMMNGLQQWMFLKGLDPKPIAPAVVDPTAHVNVQIEAICVKLGIPVPVFKGYEIGEQASTENRKNWNERMRQRQNSYITPNVIGPLIDRLISLGVLAEPKEYAVHWPDLTSQSEQEKANIALVKTQALAAYIAGNVEALYPPLEYLTGILDISDDEASQVLQSAEEKIDEGATGGTAPLLGLVGGITGMIELFRLASEGGLTEEQLKQQIMLFYGLDEQKAQEVIAEGLKHTAAPPLPIEPQANIDPDEEDEEEDVDTPVLASNTEMTYAEIYRFANSVFGGKP